MSDHEFNDIGKNPGLTIWRIENFKLVPISKTDYGTFYTGDSYLILYTYIKSDDDSQLAWKIHYWLGSNSSVDETTTASFKAIDLDDYLGGYPIQIREVQDNETDEFKAYFSSNIKYLEGGVESSFGTKRRASSKNVSVKDTQSNEIEEQTFEAEPIANVKTNEIDDNEDNFLIKKEPMNNRQISESNGTKHNKRLLMVKGKNEIKIIEVPFLGTSLNQSDVFILDNYDIIYVWCPPRSNPMEKMIAEQFAKELNRMENAGRSQIVRIEENWDTHDDFWSFFFNKGI